MFCCVILGPITEARKERLLTDESLEHFADVGSLKYGGSVLDRNLSPSLQQ